MAIRLRKVKPGVLSITSLLDILTVLLLFLLKSFAAEGQLLSVADLILPVSNSDMSLKRNINVIVNAKKIIVEDRTIETDIPAVLESDELLIPSLSKELKYQSERLLHVAEQFGVEYKGEVTIIADKDIPFKLLKRIMFTASANDFPNILLAVTQK